MPEPNSPEFAHFKVATNADGSICELGRGAMGVTYKAYDIKLRVDVALKVINPAQVGNASAQALFIREARAAARVRHPNVATVLYLEDAPGNFFYAMELVPGDSLYDWMQPRLPLDPLLAVSLAEQIASGLHAIHTERIVHRDLKPANIMVLRTPQGKEPGASERDPETWTSKIIDFGLARTYGGGEISGDYATATAGFRGTALYASPEQCEERSDIDGRSDLYSLGCVLWEMLIGVPPFRGRTHRELINQHVAIAVPLRQLSHLPESIQAVLARLLVKDPLGRFATAGALVEALKKCRGRLERGEEKVREETLLVDAESANATIASTVYEGGVDEVTPSPARARPFSTIYRVVFAGALVGLAAVTLTVANRGLPASLRSSGESRKVVMPVASTPSESQGQSIAVLPFVSLSADKNDEYFADGVQEDILANLSKIRALKVISRTSAQRYRGGDRNIRQIASELGVRAILEGTVRRDKKRVRVTAQLIDGQTDRHLWTETYDRDLTDIFSVQSRIAVEIAYALRANLALAELNEVNRPVNANAAAYPFYIEGRGLMARMTDAQSFDAAAVAFRTAIDLDPNFALAQAQLSMLHTQAYQWGFDRTPERLAQALIAANEAYRLQPSLPESQLALGTYYYRGFRDYDRALPYFKQALLLMPGNADALYAVASLERRRGNWEEAAAKFDRVAEGAPFDPIINFNAANTHFYMRQYEEAWRILEPALRHVPDAPMLRFLKGELFLAWKGDLKPMIEDVETRSPQVPTPEIYLVSKIQLLLYQRKFDEALEVLRSSSFKVAEGQAIYITRLAFEAEILTQAGRTAEAKVLWRQVAGDLQPQVEARPSDARIRIAYALALAGVGENPDAALDQARLAAKEIPLEKDAMDAPIILTGSALVSLRLGRIPEAKETVEEIKKIPSITSDAVFSLSPAWDALRVPINSTPPIKP